MRVVVVTAGSHGDVAPYTGLGARLRDAGHDVVIATHPVFAGMIRDSGLGFRPLPGDPQRLHGADRNSEPPRARPTGTTRAASAFLTRLGVGILDAAQDADALLLATTVAPVGWHVAEGLGIPSMGIYLQPADPTRAFAPPILGDRSFGPHLNHLSSRVVRAVIERLYAPAVAHLRGRLGLPRQSTRAAHRRRDATAWPVCHGYSPLVVSRPADWREGLDVVGYWWPQRPQGWQPQPALERFLDTGPPPVFVGFGSMGAGQGRRLAELVVAAVRRAGVRAIVQSGWAGLTAETTSADTPDPQILTIDEVPHDWLFPRMAAVVHHAGAGTTAAGLRAGVPTVPVPIRADQPFWAARLTALGVAPHAVPFPRLTPERLADAIGHAVTDPTFGHRARDVSHRLADEDGAGAVIASLDRLPHATD